MVVYLFATIFCVTVSILHGIDATRILRRGNTMLVQAQRIVVSATQPELIPQEQDPDADIGLGPILDANPYTPAMTQYVVGSVHTVLGSGWLFAAVYMAVKAWT